MLAEDDAGRTDVSRQSPTRLLELRPGRLHSGVARVADRPSRVFLSLHVVSWLSYVRARMDWRCFALSPARRIVVPMQSVNCRYSRSLDAVIIPHLQYRTQPRVRSNSGRGPIRSGQLCVEADNTLGRMSDDQATTARVRRFVASAPIARAIARPTPSATGGGNALPI